MSGAAHGVGGFLERGFELEPSEFLSCGLFEKAAPPACSDEPIHGVDHLVGDDYVGACHQTTVLSIPVCPTDSPTVDEVEAPLPGTGLMSGGHVKPNFRKRRRGKSEARIWHGIWHGTAS